MANDGDIASYRHRKRKVMERFRVLALVGIREIFDFEDVFHFFLFLLMISFTTTVTMKIKRSAPPIIQKTRGSTSLAADSGSKTAALKTIKAINNMKKRYKKVPFFILLTAHFDGWSFVKANLYASHLKELFRSLVDSVASVLVVKIDDLFNAGLNAGFGAFVAWEQSDIEGAAVEVG